MFTDVEASTRAWEQYGPLMGQALARHDELFEAAVAHYSGVVVRPRGEGDSRFAVFPLARDAIAAAYAIQASFRQESWPLPEPLRVRIAVHTGEADLREGDYYGTAVNRCARLRAIAHGGQVVVSAVTAGLVHDNLPDGVILSDLGTHRLRDLSQPERVYQLVHPALPGPFPPLKSVDAHRTNLPFQPTSFVGRQGEIADVRRLLGAAHVVTLTGTGGAGKTRLAMQIAADIIDEFDDGVWMAELAPLVDPAALPRALAQAVGVIEQPGRPLLETLLESVRTKAMLVVLDNCEHLVRACALLVETLLRSCPDLRVLATSREPLSVAGEVAWAVPSLGLPQPGLVATRENVGSTEAVALFVDRAVASRPGFVLTDGNAPAVAELCRRLDGMPLAIELAAARVRVLAPEQIAQRLDNRFGLLTTGLRTAPTRQQTLHAAIDWSYELLTVQEQALFARLSVFVGGFDLEAAETVCVLEQAPEISSPEVLDLLSQLVDKSLVVAESNNGGGGHVRYRLLETLREYARERLADRNETASLRHQHAAHFVRQALLAEPNLGGPEQAMWLERLEADHDNLLAALKWAVYSGEIESGLTLGGAIMRFWATRHPREGSEWLAKLLSSPGAVAPAIRARALNVAGNLAQELGDLQHAAALQEACVQLQRHLDNPPELSVAVNSLAGVLMDLGQYAGAQAALEESLELRRKLGDPRRVAVAVLNLAELARRKGDLSQATALFHEGMALAREGGDERNVGVAMNNLSLIETALGRYDQAAMHLGDAVEIFRRAGSQPGVAECCHRLAEIACFRGHGTLAARLLGASSALRETVGNVLSPAERAEYDRGVAAARGLIGEDAYAVAWADGHADAAERVLADALRVLTGVPST